MRSTITNGPLRMSAGAAVLALALAGCGGGGAGQDAKTVADTSPTASASPTGGRELALTDDTAGADAGEEVTVDALANDTVTRQDGTDAPLLSTFGPARLTLTVDGEPRYGTVTVDGTSLTYTAKAGHTGEDEFTYRVAVKDETALDAVAHVRITVTEPTPSPTPTPTPKPKPKPTPAQKTKAPAEPSVHYENCDAARAAGAAPVHRGDPGYAAHLDRDNDGVGCEPYGSSGSSGGSSGGSSSTGGSSGGGGGSTYYANCTAVRAAGAAPIHRGDPGYASHLDRDGDGVACE